MTTDAYAEQAKKMLQTVFTLAKTVNTERLIIGKKYGLNYTGIRACALTDYLRGTFTQANGRDEHRFGRRMERVYAEADLDEQVMKKVSGLVLPLRNACLEIQKLIGENLLLSWDYSLIPSDPAREVKLQDSSKIQTEIVTYLGIAEKWKELDAAKIILRKCEDCHAVWGGSETDSRCPACQSIDGGFRLPKIRCKVCGKWPDIQQDTFIGEECGLVRTLSEGDEFVMPTTERCWGILVLAAPEKITWPKEK